MPYTVVKGDTLRKLAAKYGVSWQQLYEANKSVIGGDPNLIKPNQILVVPGDPDWGGAAPKEEASPTTEGGLPPTGISEEQDELISEVMGGDPEIWYDQDTEKWYLVYYVPNTDVPLLYEAEGDQMDALFPDGDYTADRIVHTSFIEKRGGIYAGTADDPYGDPYATFIEMLEKESKIAPWLMDADMLAILFEATLEGRQVSRAELSQTEWWQSHNEAQRAWLMLYHSDPRTAEQNIADAVIATRDALQAAGVDNATDEMIDFMATAWVSGDWTEAQWMDQVRAVSDPYSGITIDAGLQEAIGATKLDTTRTHEERVRQKVLEWLGPIHGDWTEAQIAKWAGTLRNNPDGETELVEYLRGQRMAIWGEYENENLTYEDIAGAYRNLWERTWGQPADETDPLFEEIMRLNDYAAAGQTLRQEGLGRGNETVMQKLESDVMRTGRTLRQTF